MWKKINKIIEESIPEFESETSDTALCWDNLKRQITNFAKKYSKTKAIQASDYEVFLAKKLETCYKKLNMINLQAANAVSLIEKVNDKIDYYQKEQEKIQLHKTQGILLRTKARWVEQGEKNTKYFFGLEKANAKKKAMCQCQLPNGEIIHNPQQIVFEQAKFYSKLYTKQPGVSFDLRNNTGPILNATQRILLDSEYTCKEFGDSVRSMSNNKSPGADGLPVEFYKVFWGKLDNILLKVFNCACDNKVLHESGRIGLISLIPKKRSRQITYC